MPDAQNEGLLTGLYPYGLLLGTLRGHSGTASACNVTKKILTATTQAQAKNLRTQAAAYKDNPSVWKITSHRVTEPTASRPLQPEQQRQLLVSKEEGRTVCSQSCRNCKAPHLHARHYTCRQRALKLSWAWSTPNARHSISDVDKHSCAWGGTQCQGLAEYSQRSVAMITGEKPNQLVWQHKPKVRKLEFSNKDMSDEMAKTW